MEEEREDGEISDTGSTTFEDNVYNPIVRPNSNTCRPRAVSSAIISSEDESSSEDSDSDSEIKSRPKRMKTNFMQMEVERNGNQNCAFMERRKRNNIWANVIQEEELTSEIGGVGLKKLKGDRNIENYDYTQALKIHRSEKEESTNTFEIKETEEDVQKRMMRKRRFHDCFSEKKKEKKKQNKPRYLSDIEVSPDLNNEELGNLIADALYEQKPELVVRVVEVLGQEAALELYKKTQEIEKGGGMMILNGSRRRTSGGVFLQLLKSREGVEKSHLAQIFTDENKESQQWRKRKRMNRKRQKRKDEGGNAKSEDDVMHLKDLFSDDPGGTKCPGSTPVTSPTASDNEESESLGPKMHGSQISFLPLKEVCEKAASEINLRDRVIQGVEAEAVDSYIASDAQNGGSNIGDFYLKQDEMETC